MELFIYIVHSVRAPIIYTEKGSFYLLRNFLEFGFFFKKKKKKKKKEGRCIMSYIKGSFRLKPSGVMFGALLFSDFS